MAKGSGVRVDGFPRGAEAESGTWGTNPPDVQQHDILKRPGVESSCWASIPPELLRDILKRVEDCEDEWPHRKSLVACAGVCSSWREVTRDVVRGPETTGKLTFPVSLKQPGSRDAAIQCFIRRDRTTHTYSLYLGLPPSSVEGGKFLLAARKSRHVQKTDYVISLDGEDFNKGSTNYMGKLRSNFLGTKFTIYDSQPPSNCPSIKTVGRTSSGRGSKQVSPKPPLGSFPVAGISYELNVLGTRGPRRMQATLHSVPSSALEPGGCVPYPLEVDMPSFVEDASEPVMAVNTPTLNQAVPFPSPRNVPLNRSMKHLSVNTPPSSPTSILPAGATDVPDSPSGKKPLVLRNKCPRWHEQLQCWCLNFRGRVTVASVKNFQLVAAGETAGSAGGPEVDKQVLLQFGKVGNDMFTMDYRYPLSAFQAFAICLSSFDTKLACE